MPLPDRIEVGAHTYTVVLCDEIRNDDDSRLWGRCEHANLVIRICSQLAPTRRVSTLLHEIVHAVASVTQVEVPEADVDRLAEGLASALVRSGMLRRSLLRDD